MPYIEWYINSTNCSCWKNKVYKFWSGTEGENDMERGDIGEMWSKHIYVILKELIKNTKKEWT